MADLPRYQSTGRVYSDLPQLDFANVRESFKQSQTLSNQLDRLSTYAFTEMGKQTEKQAAQFAIDNPLTNDQVREASKSGVKPEDLIAASGGGEKWQATISKIQGEQLRSQLEILGKQALLDLQTQVDTNQIADMSEVKAKQEAIVNGMRKTLSFAPDSVMRFDATMGVVTSALYKEAQDKLVKDYKIGEQSKSAVNFDNSIRAYQSILEHGQVNDPAMLREIEYSLADQFERQSAGGGSDFALIKKNAFVEKMQTVKIDYFVKQTLTEKFDKDPYAISKIANGDFGDANINNNFLLLNSTDQQTIIDKAVKRRADRLDAFDKDKKNVLLQNEQNNKNDYKIIYDPNNGVLKSVKDEKALSLFESGYLSKDEYKSYVSSKDPEFKGDPILLGSIKRRIWQGTIKTEEQIKATAGGKLNSDQIGTLISLIGVRDFSSYNSGLNLIVNDTSKAWETPKYDAKDALNDAAQDELIKNPNMTLTGALEEVNKKRVASDKFQTALRKQRGYYTKWNKSWNMDKESADNFIKRKNINPDSNKAQEVKDDYEDYLKQKNGVTYYEWNSLKNTEGQ